MALQTLGLASFGALTEEQQRVQLEAFLSAPANGESNTILESITRLENRYEMSSETMSQRFHRGEIRETEEIGAWLTLIDTRNLANSSSNGA